MFTMSKPTGTGVPLSQPTEQPEKPPCPRCESTNTKFCYYNNYNLSQPRYFCKSCRRYWTRGGTLRNVPVGGGTRKNNSKRPRSSSTATPSSSSTAAVYAAVAPPPVPPCDVDLNLNEGSFTSLLTCDPTGSSNNVGFNGAGGYGVGTGFGFGFGFGPDVGSTWQMGNGGDGMDGGDCFGWSDLAISTAGNGLQ